MVKPTKVSVLGLLAGRDGPSEGAMGHWGLVVGVRVPSRTSPMPTVILKCQSSLLYDLKHCLPSILAVNFGAIILCLDRKGQ